MTKRLLLMRHAKSSWSEPGLADYDRPLNSRGKRDARRAGTEILNRECAPELIVASSAKRTVTTAKRIAKTCGFDGSIWTTRDLYLAPFDAYSSAIAESPQGIQTMLLIGHNPTVAQWLEQLTGEMHPVPTATIASIMMHLDHWSEMMSDTVGTLEWIWFPKMDTDANTH